MYHSTFDCKGPIINYLKLISYFLVCDLGSHNQCFLRRFVPRFVRGWNGFSGATCADIAEWDGGLSRPRATPGETHSSNYSNSATIIIPTVLECKIETNQIGSFTRLAPCANIKLSCNGLQYISPVSNINSFLMMTTLGRNSIWCRSTANCAMDLPSAPSLLDPTFAALPFLLSALSCSAVWCGFVSETGVVL